MSRLRATVSHHAIAWHKRPVLRLLLAAVLLAPTARAADRVTLGLDWRAEAEYGGYYQALATGLYTKYGLDVQIRQGGPQVNQTQLLLAGRLTFAIASNSLLALNFVAQDLPLTTVAAFFQKDPSILLAHPGTGHDSFAALRGQNILISADTSAGWWNYLKAKYGYTDSQIRTYTFNLGPFLADKHAIQQGYLGSEPFLIKSAAGFDPVVLSLADDAGFAGYGNLIAVRADTAARQPDLVRRFVAASAAGWTSFLHGNPAPAYAAIRADNPDMTEALLAYGRAALIAHHIVDNGVPIGSMTDARWQQFVTQMQQSGLAARNLDWHRAYNLQFLAHP